MYRVHNRHHSDVPPGAVYIGRGTPWGNMYTHLPNVPNTTQVETTEEAIEMFVKYIDEHPEFRKKIEDELKDKDLVCSCYPRPCHGYPLFLIANWKEHDAEDD